MRRRRAATVGLIMGVMLGGIVLLQDALACAPATAEQVTNQDCLTGLSYSATGNCVGASTPEEVVTLVNDLTPTQRLQMCYDGLLPAPPTGYRYNALCQLVSTTPEDTVWFINNSNDAGRWNMAVRGMLPPAPAGYYYEDNFILIREA